MSAIATPEQESVPTLAMSVDAKCYLDGMRLFAAGCCVITSRAGKEIAGLTATAVCSVTAQPPRLLVCVNREVRAHSVITVSRTLAVNVLSDRQEEVAKRFAGMVKDVAGETRFEGIEWNDGGLGAPLLHDALASFDCRVLEAIPAGTHTMFLCDVIGVTTNASVGALAYFNRNFCQLPLAHGERS